LLYSCPSNVRHQQLQLGDEFYTKCQYSSFQIKVCIER
jgi:hypothetical protein